jgi:hypothetical protein
VTSPEVTEGAFIHTVRRMLFSLDRYWLAYEYDEDFMALWWNAYESYRARVERITETAGSVDACGVLLTTSLRGPSPNHATRDGATHAPQLGHD